MTGQVVTIGMTPPHPGAFVREEIFNELRLTIQKAAAILGVRRATLSDLVNGKVSLSPEMALRLEKAFGINMETLLRMQAWHDACKMRAMADAIRVERFVPDGVTK